jgi:hypothetical protein
MDFHRWAPTVEMVRGLFGILFIFLPQCEFIHSQYPLFFTGYINYFVATAVIGLWSRTKAINRSLAL